VTAETVHVVFTHDVQVLRWVLRRGRDGRMYERLRVNGHLRRNRPPKSYRRHLRLAKASQRKEAA
jgi:hypothetical protein